jgi:hypothetical protein
MMLSQMAPKCHVGPLVAATLELARLSRRVSLPQIAEPIRELFSDLNSTVPILLAIYRRSAKRKPRTGNRPAPREMRCLRIPGSLAVPPNCIGGKIEFKARQPESSFP